MEKVKTLLTEQGYQELKNELDNLINVKRPENIKAIKDARALGDLSENAEYDAARNEQAEIEGRISQLEKLLENVEIINENKQDKSKVNVGSTVEIKYIDEDDERYVSLDNYEYDILKNTPLIIYGEGAPHKEIKDVMGMWDVFPTIANMFNLECNYSLGNDIFSDNEQIVVFPNGDVITNKIFYNNLRDEFVSLNNEPINDDYITHIREYAEKRLGVSKAIIVHDLLYKEGKVERVNSDEKSVKSEQIILFSQYSANYYCFNYYRS